MEHPTLDIPSNSTTRSSKSRNSYTDEGKFLRTRNEAMDSDFRTSDVQDLDMAQHLHGWLNRLATPFSPSLRPSDPPPYPLSSPSP
eukprot:2741477-Pyramimonas_sp.AAC.1